MTLFDSLAFAAMKILLPTLLLLLLQTGVTLAASSYQEAIGYTRLVEEYGESLPDGAGIPVAQIEFLRDNTWAPEATGQLDGVTFTYQPPTTGDFSKHAYEVGEFFYGSESMARGVDKVYAFRNTRWYTHIDFTRNWAPRDNPWRVENHSWGGTTSATDSDEQIIGRHDYRILHQEIFAAVGLDNQTGPIWPLLANSYNSITVGTTSGIHNRGGTTLYTTGRMKPDIVAPLPYTSYSTPVVAAAATLLIARADREEGLRDAARPPVIKALLMAGATKEGLDWSNSPTRPLDPVFGAGSLNVYHSYKLLLSGRQRPDEHNPGRSAAWNWGSTPPAGGDFYPLTVREGWEGKLSAVLAWNAVPTPQEDDSGEPVWIAYDYRLDNLELHLWRVDEFDGSRTSVASSISGIDNIQHLYLTDLAPGQYALEVSGSETGVSYALAWRTAPEAGIIQVADNDPGEVLTFNRIEHTQDVFLSFRGSPGSVYRVETSTDLVHWVPLESLTAGPDGTYEFVHPNGFRDRQRFYRTIRE